MPTAVVAQLKYWVTCCSRHPCDYVRRVPMFGCDRNIRVRLILNFQNHLFKGKSLLEALIFASNNPKYDDRLFIELHVQYMKIPSSNLGRNVVCRNCFWRSEKFLYTKCFPMFCKKRASDKDLPVLMSWKKSLRRRKKCLLDMQY